MFALVSVTLCEVAAPTAPNMHSPSLFFGELRFVHADDIALCVWWEKGIALAISERSKPRTIPANVFECCTSVPLLAHVKVRFVLAPTPADGMDHALLVCR